MAVIVRLRCCVVVVVVVVVVLFRSVVIAVVRLRCCCVVVVAVVVAVVSIGCYRCGETFMYVARPVRSFSLGYYVKKL